MASSAEAPAWGRLDEGVVVAVRLSSVERGFPLDKSAVSETGLGDSALVSVVDCILDESFSVSLLTAVLLTEPDAFWCVGAAAFGSVSSTSPSSAFFLLFALESEVSSTLRFVSTIVNPAPTDGATYFEGAEAIELKSFAPEVSPAAFAAALS